jgi:F0F1-type ATP synthase beta subunit
MARLTGQVVQVMGGVVDVEFPIGQLPNVYDALEAAAIDP